MISFSRLNNIGRLGNQLFQVAFITFFAQKYGVKYKLPYWQYADQFDYDFNFSENLTTMKYDLILREPGLGYHEEYFKQYISQIRKLNVDIITGYFQSYKYFSKEHVLKIFRFKNNFKTLEVCSEKSVAVSVRRGDFVLHPDYNNIEANTFLTLLSLFKGYKIYVFTDDYKYCRRNFIGPEYEFLEGLNDIEQLILMSKFKYYILSNSTFSYWGPMLSQNPKKVFYPYYMFPDINRCKLYNRDYWPNDKNVYTYYENEINKPLLTSITGSYSKP